MLARKVVLVVQRFLRARPMKASAADDDDVDPIMRPTREAMGEMPRIGTLTKTATRPV